MAEAEDYTRYEINTTALSSSGRKRFSHEFTDTDLIDYLKSAKSFCLKSFSLSAPKQVDRLTLFVEDIGGVAYPTVVAPNDAEIHLSANYVETYSSDSDILHYEIKGVLIHMSAHIWQNSVAHGTRKSISGIIEGIGDFIRLRSGFPALHWKRSEEANWSDGYDTTAYFMDWIDQNVTDQFVNHLNALMVSPWNDTFFDIVTGRNVLDLWSEYQTSNWSPRTTTRFGGSDYPSPSMGGECSSKSPGLQR